MAYIRGFDVRYEDQDGLVLESSGYIVNNINNGFGGKFVYIKPTYTMDKFRAATSFQLTVTYINDIKDRRPDIKDLAKGAGGPYRYITPVYDGHSIPTKRVVSTIYFTETNPDRTSCTENINQGREGRNLFLCWETGILTNFPF